MRSTRTVLFLCPHTAAKSLLAVAAFDRMAATRGVPFRADSAGTEPDAGPTPAVVDVLRTEGIDVANHRPRPVTAADLANAHRVISMGCTLDELPLSLARIEQWDDIPPVSQDLEAARQAIRHHMAALVDELASANRDPARFVQADELVVDRSGSRHLAFGSGMHACIGAALAHLELEVVLLHRFPPLTA